MIDFEVQRCTRHCAASGRELEPGEEFYSVLVAEGAEVVRRDYAAGAWQGPPEKALGCWKSQMPRPDQKKLNWAPNDVMLDLFEQHADQPDQEDLRYVLALLLIRRRVVRLEETEHDEAGREVMVLYCPRKEETYHAVVTTPDAQRIDQLQQELAQLLFADAG